MVNILLIALYGACLQYNVSQLFISPQPIDIKVSEVHVNTVKITKVGHLWFNTFPSLSDSRRTVNVLKSHLPLLKDSAALPFTAQFNTFICL